LSIFFISLFQNRNDESNSNIKLSDFGLSTHLIYPAKKLLHQCGTPGYLSPEMLLKKGYDMKSDMYSAGCVLYTLYFLRNQRKIEFLGQDHLMIQQSGKFLKRIWKMIIVFQQTVGKILVFKVFSITID